MEDWKFGPPILVGERVVWVKNSAKPTESGVVRWIGKLSKESADWTVGVELDNSLPCGGTDGAWGDRRLFRCNPRKGVFLPLSRIRKEVPKDNSEDKQKYSGTSRGRINKYEDGGNSPKRGEMDPSVTGRTLKEVPNWTNDINGRLAEGNEGNATSDSDDLKSDVQSVRKSARRRRKRNKSPRAVTRREDFHPGARRPFSVTGRIGENESQSKDKWHKKHESCALEEKYIREFIQREINKQQNGVQSPGGKASPPEDGMMNEVKGNFKRIDEDEIHGYGSTHPDAFHYKPKKYDGNGRVSRRNEAFHRREKSSGFFSFFKWFKKSKEMPELEGTRDCSVTSSPLFIRRRSSSCGSVDTLFSIATANSFAFVSPVQYQAVISSSHTTYPAPLAANAEDESKNRNQSDYENNPSPAKGSKEVKTEGQSTTDKKKKSRAPDPPVVRDISLPSTLEHKKNEEDDPEGKGGHRRTVSESFKDKKAGFYCHVQGKRKAPLPPQTAPLYPSLSSLKSQCPSISKKKRPAPPPPEGKDVKPKEKSADAPKSTGDSRTTPNYDNLPFLNAKANEESSQKEVSKANSSNLSPLLGLPNDLSSSPLPSRPWYKRSSSGSNILKKESGKFGDRKKNKENEDWMPEVGFSRRPISNESSHNLFNLLSRLDKNQEKKKEEKRKSQISILANISELDREAAEIVRKEHAQEKRIMANKDEKYYSSPYDKNVLSMFPNIQNGAEGSSEKVPASGGTEKTKDTPKGVTRNPFDEFKRTVDPETISPGDTPGKTKECEKKAEEGNNKEMYDANAELDYYINPWNCPKCTLENPGWEKYCEACNTIRAKFRPSAEGTRKNEAEASKEVAVKTAEEKPKVTKSKSEEAPSTPSNKEPEDPSEDNLEGVRRKRLAFFTSRQSSLRESSRASSSDEDDKLKLKMMLKEMKNSLPKCEKGVINNAVPEARAVDGAAEESSSARGPNLASGERASSGDAESKPSPKEFSNTKVQQTWQPIANEPNKYGAMKKVKQHEPTPSLTTAEAIIVTKTTVLEDIIVKKKDKGQKVSTSVQTSSSVNDQNPEKSKDAAKTGDGHAASGQVVGVPGDHAYANVQKIKEKHGVLDLTVPENTFATGDIEAITAKLQQEGAGSVDYQVDIQATSSKAGTNTFDVNQQLRKLEAAINTGRHLEAANIAKELARMKVSCSVKRQKLVPDAGQSKIIVDLYVEDKLTHKGPIQIQIIPSITLGQLKMKVEREWDIPRNVQRWILGKHLATDDAKTLEQHGVVNNSCPLFLYLVAPEQTGNGTENSDSSKNEPDPGKTDRKSGKFPIMYGEARRPSLIIEESGESECEEGEGGGDDDDTQATDKCDEIDGSAEAREVKEKSCENARVSTPGAKRREMFQSSFSFEKRDIKENLKKELKVISANSVKERIEQLNRAATGGGSEAKTKGDSRAEANKQKWHYNELMQLENADLVANTEEFECPVCLVGYEPGEGVVLKDCLHTFCRPCLVNTIQFNEEAEVKCPYRDEKYSCESVLQQREIKSLVPKGIFEQHLAKSVSVAENNIGNAYHCKTPDCKGWCILEDNVNEFRCPVCRLTNCLTCQSIHTGMNCRQYQEQIQFASDTNVEAKKTRDMLQEMVEKGEAMACPTCQVVLMKKWGCDWLRCSMCKTEICWVTRGPRWGPGGKGDTSGGCQCGVNGIKCHPKCNYCH